jgi:hypothetical protein
MARTPGAVLARRTIKVFLRELATLQAHFRDGRTNTEGVQCSERTVSLSLR